MFRLLAVLDKEEGVFIIHGFSLMLIRDYGRDTYLEVHEDSIFHLTLCL